jgi:hypothetical protein
MSKAPPLSTPLNAGMVRAGKTVSRRSPGVGDYLVALQTYFAAVRRWPDAKITLRNRARIIEQSWED